MSDEIWVLSVGDRLRPGDGLRAVTAYSTLGKAQRARDTLRIPEGTPWSIQSMSVDVWHPIAPDYNPEGDDES